MKKRKGTWIPAVLCAVVIGALVLLGARQLFGSPKKDPSKGETQESPFAATEEKGAVTREDASQEEQSVIPSKLPSRVELTPTRDPKTGREVLSFPYTVPGYGLTLEKLAPYEGAFVEDGTDRAVEGVGMILVKNSGDLPIEYASLTVNVGGEALRFDLSALPSGERAVVQEKTGKALPEKDPASAEAVIIQRPELEMNEDRVKVKDNGNDTLTVTNLTGETLSSVRVFYKYYMEKENVFVGGIAFNVRVTGLAPGASTTIRPAHFTSASCRVVMVQTDA